MNNVKWDLIESGPAGADRGVLCLAGALCTGEFFAELMAEPALDGVRIVAAALPGQGGTPPIDDLSVESYARLCGKLAADLGCDVIVGHSLGANVALEMAASGVFGGPVVLLAPSLSRADESKFPRTLDKLGRVFGNAPFALAIAMMNKAFKGAVPPERLDTLVGILRSNEPGLMRAHLRLYLAYLDRHGTLAPRLCGAGVPVWLVLGEHDETGISNDERRTLDACPQVNVRTIAGSTHFIQNWAPATVADIARAALDAVRP